MRSDRLLAMLLLLQSRGQMSAAELADELEVSTRTVYRDMESLSSAGVPVYAERGRTGGITIMPGFHTDVTGLTVEESRALFVLVADDAHADLGIGEALRSGLRKLMAALPEAQQDLAARSTDRIIIDPGRWGGEATGTPQLAAVQEAVLTDHRLGFRYERRDSDDWTDYPATDPHGLVHRGGRWYLVAGVDGEDRMFRVDRMHDAVVRDDLARRPVGFSLRETWHALNESWRRNQHRTPVRIRVRRPSLGLLTRVHAADLAEPFERHGDPGQEWTELTLLLRSHGHARTLLGYGTDIEVLDPPELVTYLDGIIDELARRGSAGPSAGPDAAPQATGADHLP